MAGFTSRADLIAHCDLGKVERFVFHKTIVGIQVNQWQTLWRLAGSPGAGAVPATTPGTVYATTDASSAADRTGPIYFPNRSTDQRYLLSFGASYTGAVPVTLMLYDRLAAVSGISVTTTGAKTINSGALSRYSGTAATDNEVWIEVTTAFTTSVIVAHLNSYTTADGSTGQTGPNSTAVPAANLSANSMLQISPNTTKRGVRSVEAGLNVDTAPAAGVCNVVILRELARIGVNPGAWTEVNFLDDYMELPRIYDGATLGLAAFGAASSGELFGSIQCVYG